MAKKHLSVIIVPHTKTSTKTLSFSRRALRFLGGSGVAFGLVLAAVLVDYVSMNVIRSKYKALKKEATEQRTAIASYEKSIGELQATISHFENYTKKLNVMAGLKSADVLTSPAGLGGGETGEEPASAADPRPGDPNAANLGTVRNLSEKARGIESNLNDLLSLFESKAVELSTRPSIMPTAGWLSSDFGHRDDPFTGVWTMHYGIDISTNAGNPILATADGIVIKVQTDKYLGKNVTISHGNGYTTVYGHMSNFAVKAGQRVKRRDVIGYIGMTGKAVGPHVHYEVWKDGKKVNPFLYILEE
jgi:murein DD-endopeptidase MepM/ murein hydrolase activator NlpD